MKVLALDYGSARCGCALSDATQTLASPACIVEKPASKTGLAAISKVIEQNAVTDVIVGLPRALSGRETDQTLETKRFIEQLQRSLSGTGVKLHMHDERLTTALARRLGAGGKTGREADDAHAAAVLLQSWLDQHR